MQAVWGLWVHADRELIRRNILNHGNEKGNLGPLAGKLHKMGRGLSV